MAKNKAGALTSKNNTFTLVALGALLLVVFFILLSVLRSFFQTETYYVLDGPGETYPARTLVTADILEPVVVPKGATPPTAVSLEEIQGSSTPIRTKHPLQGGDIITTTNAESGGDIQHGIPDDWVVTNFSVGADSAVGGRITYGDYFDILVASDNGSFYPFVNVLALDTTVDLSSASSAAAAETSEAYEGQTSQYVVAMSPENAARLHTVVEKYKTDIRLVMSPKQNEYNTPRVDDYDGVYSVNDSDQPIWPGQATDSSGNEVEITDSNFTPIQRNEAGEPTEFVESATGGNNRSGETVDIPTGQQEHPDPEPQSNEESGEQD